MSLKAVRESRAVGGGGTHAGHLPASLRGRPPTATEPGGPAYARPPHPWWTNEPRARPPSAHRAGWSFRTGLIAVDALPVAWMAFCLGLGIGPINTFLSIFAQSRGMQNPGLF